MIQLPHQKITPGLLELTEGQLVPFIYDINIVCLTVSLLPGDAVLSSLLKERGSYGFWELLRNYGRPLRSKTLYTCAGP